MSRAAGEPDAAAKEAHVRRVALASPEHGWFIASQAIASVEDGTQRCRLRTILAGLPGIRNRERLGNEARDECNAILLKGRT